jgi:hypothetical protein
MSESQAPPRVQALQLAGVIAGMVVMLNVAFFVLSKMYVEDRPKEMIDLTGARLAFALLTKATGIMAFAAARAPRVIGHGYAGMLGLASLVGGVQALRADLPPVMGVTLLVLGVLQPTLAWLSWQRSRASWAFLIAIVAVFGVVTLFGAPKIRSLLDINLWYAFLLPAQQFVCVAALAMLRDDYRERS